MFSATTDIRNKLVISCPTYLDFSKTDQDNGMLFQQGGKEMHLFTLMVKLICPCICARCKNIIELLHIQIYIFGRENGMIMLALLFKNEKETRKVKLEL